MMRALLAVCTCILGILLVAALYLAREVLLPLAVAILLTFILTPLAMRLQRRGLGRVPSVILVTALAFLVVGGFGVVVAAQIRSLAIDLPTYRDNIIRKAAALRNLGPGHVFDNLEHVISDINKELSREDPGASRAVPVEIQHDGRSQFQAMAGPLLSLLANFALVAILVVFMLARHEDLRDRLIRLIGHGRLTDTTRALEEASQRVSRFLQMQLLTNLCFGGLLGLGLFLIGVPQAFLWGLMVGAMRFVPYLGSPVGGLMLIVLSVAIFPNWVQPLEVFGVYLVLELVVANVVEPLLFGHSTGVSPVALLMAAAFWTWLWGPAGLLLSTPLTVCLVVMGRYVPGLGFLGVLLSDEPALSLGQRYYQRLLAHDPDEAMDLVEEHLKAHPAEPFYDEVLLPALVMTRRDEDRGTLSSGDAHAVFGEMRLTLNEMMPINNHRPKLPGPVVLGIPTSNEGDELALAMMQQLLAVDGCRLEVLAPGTPLEEIVARVAVDQPAGVLIASLPPGGLSPARYQCKRLRAELPELKILVGRWGQKDDLDQMRERVKTAGADAVGATLLESRVQVLPLFQKEAPSARETREEAAALT
jgi:predicted PurR-regulated permease PerM